MKITQSTLDKLEDILSESEYVVRYERGNFQSGWCLLELIPLLTIEFDKLTRDSQKLYEEVKRIALSEA